MTCRVGAHRGWTRAGPENSLAAIAGAAEVADFAEIDVRLSADGIAVLSHDPVVGGLAVSDHAAKDLAAVGAPTFAEAVEAIGDFPLDIEVKPDVDPSVLVEVCRLARPVDWVTSFNWALADEVRRRRPDVATGLLLDAGWDFAGAVREATAGGHPLVLPHFSLVDGPVDGVEVAVWTVNDVEDAARLADYGVAAVISDRPDLIAEVCR